MWPKGRLNHRASDAELQAELEHQKAMHREWCTHGRKKDADMHLKANMSEIRREMRRRAAMNKGHHP
jgi:hypothetical protein